MQKTPNETPNALRLPHGVQTYTLMNRQIQRLSYLPRPLVVVLAMALLLLIGILDYFTGHDFTLSAFYLMPICWVAWMVGQRAGVILAIFGAISWLLADFGSGYIYAHPLIRYWNVLMLIVIFLIVVRLLTNLVASNLALHDTVLERTAALRALELEIKERKRLEEAKLQAERLAVMGRMAAQVAHEVRNPLGSITLNLDLVQKEIERLAGDKRHSPNEGRELITDMREEICRIGSVIEDYLHFARLPKLRRQSLALNAFLDQKLGFLSTELKRANVNLHTHFHPAETTINGDADQLWQVLLNLIRKSCEAMPGGGDLIIESRRGAGQVLLLVTDNGVGMTEEQRQQLFVPFFTTKKGGHGLGMALAHQIVSEHGGHIECQSSGGKGSTFTIFLPVVETP